MIKRHLLRITAILVVGICASTAAYTHTASAVSSANWKAGDIIDDALFYDNAAMSVDQIQSFLNSKVPVCDTQGTQSASDLGYPTMTHAQYAAMKQWPGPPYVCLKDYYQVPRSDVIVNNYSGSVPAGAISAAEIIKKAADTYGVSPKSLLVLLHKESLGPLTVDTWPLQSQYKNAMGMGCPDTAPCDPQYAGFYNQMMNAAERFYTYKNNPTSFRHQPFAYNNIYFNPGPCKTYGSNGTCSVWYGRYGYKRDIDYCKSSSVYIETRATAGLYNYTPYQPNAEALNNLYGSGDDCSAYGNRNFWRIYSDWFGSTSATIFYGLSDPRWMQLKTATPKYNAQLGTYDSSSLPIGMQRRFTSKVRLSNGELCLRTEVDTSLDNPYCIPMSSLEELNPTYTLLPTSEQSKEFNISDGASIDMARDKKVTDYSLARQVIIVAKTTIYNKDYYITKDDYEARNLVGIPSSQISASGTYQQIERTCLELKQDTKKTSPFTQLTNASVAKKGTILSFTSRVQVNGKWYYRTEDDSRLNISVAYDESLLQTPSFESFVSPRWMKINKQTTRYDISKETRTGTVVNAEEQFKFTSKITLNGTTYYRSEADTNSNSATAFRAADVSDLSYLPFVLPRQLTLTSNASKVDPVMDQTLTDTFQSGLTRRFTSKVYVNGKWYYRTETDTTLNLSSAFDSSLLRDT